MAVSDWSSAVTATTQSADLVGTAAFTGTGTLTGSGVAGAERSAFSEAATATTLSAALTGTAEFFGTGTLTAEGSAQAVTDWSAAATATTFTPTDLVGEAFFTGTGTLTASGSDLEVSPWSQAVTATTNAVALPAPPTPDGLTVTPSDTTALASWQASSGATSYELDYEPVTLLSGTADFTGTGSLTVQAESVVVMGSASFGGTGTLSATGSPTLSGEAALSGSGTLAAITPASVLTANYTDSLPLAEALTFHLEPVLEDAMGTSDTVTMVRGLTLSDTVATTDALARTASYVRTLSSTAALVDATSLNRSLTLAITDSLTLRDGLAGDAVGFRDVFDTAGLSDTATTARTLNRAVQDDNAGLSESVALSFGRTFTAESTVNPTDAISTDRRIAAAVDALSPAGLTDSISIDVLRGVRATSNEFVLDDVTTVLDAQRALTDAMETSDTTARHLARTVEDSLALSDASSYTVAFGVDVADTITVTDSSDYLLTHIVVVTDSAGPRDRLEFYAQPKRYQTLTVTRGRRRRNMRPE